MFSLVDHFFFSGWYIGDLTSTQSTTTHQLDLSYGTSVASFGSGTYKTASTYGIYYRSKTLVSSSRVSCMDWRTCRCPGRLGQVCVRFGVALWCSDGLLSYQPTNPVIFAVVALGVPPLLYQWPRATPPVERTP